jgi:hypothetical protein
MITATDIAKSTPQEVLFPALSPPFRNGRRYTFGSLALAAAPVGAHRGSFAALVSAMHDAELPIR